MIRRLVVSLAILSTLSAVPASAADPRQRWRRAGPRPALNRRNDPRAAEVKLMQFVAAYGGQWAFPARQAQGIVARRCARLTTTGIAGTQRRSLKKGETMVRRILSLIAIAATLAATPAGAADLKVTSAGAVRGLIAQIIDDYSKQTGQKFDFTIGTTGQLRNIIATGQHADLIIVSTPLMGELEKTGKLTAGSRADLGRVGIGVTVREGATVPNVSTPDAFKQALMAARSIAYTDPAEGGTSGIYFNNLADKLGIGDAVRKKAMLTKGGREAAIEVAEGRVEMAIVFVSEAMAVKGVKLAGPLPAPLQDYSVYAAAIPASSTDAAAARAFIAALTSAAMAERWRANGFEPPTR
jgi:molybdate transport system substrate-binding protein